jgi:hypothetical protein
METETPKQQVPPWIWIRAIIFLIMHWLDTKVWYLLTLDPSDRLDDPLATIFSIAYVIRWLVWFGVIVWMMEGGDSIFDDVLRELGFWVVWGLGGYALFGGILVVLMGVDAVREVGFVVKMVLDGGSVVGRPI